eukprot:11888801-Alexandrium_andersonii.AAC.1
MSASLVGSEMCIRDSCTPGPPREAPPARPPARFVVAIGFSARNGTEPVSYTHLTLPTICSV